MKTDEAVIVNHIDELNGTIDNLKWLIPLALDKSTSNKKPIEFIIRNR